MADMTTRANLPPPTSGVHHETTDASVGGVFAFGLALMIAGVIILVLVWLLFGYFKGREAGSGALDFPLALEQQNRLPPEPPGSISPARTASGSGRSGTAHAARSTGRSGSRSRACRSRSGGAHATGS